MTDRELMQQALEALEKMKAHSYLRLDYAEEAITALRDRLAQPEQETGNLLKDAYNAMVEKKTRSQKLREAGFTRRPKGWEKEKDVQEPVGHADLGIDNIYIFNEFEPRVVPAGRTPLYTTPQHMTPQAYLYVCDGDVDHPVLTHKKMDWPEKYSHWQEIPLVMAQRPWVGLTDEEINAIPDREYMDFYKDIEAKLKEKNT